MQLVDVDPAGTLTAQYRSYIEHVMLPLARKATATIEAHSAVAELPTRAQMKERFPKMDWDTVTAEWFSQRWLSYTTSWGRVLKLWAAGDYATARPVDMQPLAGLKIVMELSRMAAEAKQVITNLKCHSHTATPQS